MLYFASVLIAVTVLSCLCIAAILYFGQPLRLSHQSWFSLLTVERSVTKEIRFGGKRLRITLGDNNVKNWLKNVVAARRAALSAGRTPIRLVACRKDFRRIVGRRRIAGLVWCLQEPDRHLRRIAIWLLGRLGRSGATFAVADFRSHPDPAVRRDVARALRRMGALVELYAMSENDADPRVQRIAGTAGIAPRAYRDRLSQFAAHAAGLRETQAHLASSMPLFMQAPVGPGTPPKTRHFIRQMLEHIRRLVRGASRNHAA